MNEVKFYCELGFRNPYTKQFFVEHKRNAEFNMLIDQEFNFDVDDISLDEIYDLLNELIQPIVNPLLLVLKEKHGKDALDDFDVDIDERNKYIMVDDKYEIMFWDGMVQVINHETGEEKSKYW